MKNFYETILSSVYTEKGKKYCWHFTNSTSKLRFNGTLKGPLPVGDLVTILKNTTMWENANVTFFISWPVNNPVQPVLTS